VIGRANFPAHQINKIVHGGGENFRDQVVHPYDNGILGYPGQLVMKGQIRFGISGQFFGTCHDSEGFLQNFNILGTDFSPDKADGSLLDDFPVFKNRNQILVMADLHQGVQVVNILYGGKILYKGSSAVLGFYQAQNSQLLNGGPDCYPADAEHDTQRVLRRQFFPRFPDAFHQLLF
jgi:hypothetical protein